MGTEQALCPWCREGDHEGCIGDSDPYGPPCECDHDEPQQAFCPDAVIRAELAARAALEARDVDAWDLVRAAVARRAMQVVRDGD